MELQGMNFTEYKTPHEIDQLVGQVAKQINRDYRNLNPIFVTVLTGAFIYASDLLRKITIPTEIAFVKLRSYVGTETTGEVQETVPVTADIMDRDVIVIEDIIDTGLSMHYLKKRLYQLGAKSVKVTSFLFKPDALQYPDSVPEYPALLIPHQFVIGYGLDLDQQVRNLPALYIYDKSAKDAPLEK